MNTEIKALHNLGLSRQDCVVVVGAGVSGQAAVRLLCALGLRVLLLDRNQPQFTDSFTMFVRQHNVEVIFGEHTVEQFQGVRLVVTSPGVPLKVFDDLGLASMNIPVIGEMELALRCIDIPILALTGTSGKTTTVSLMHAILEKAGKKVFLGGNIGTPLSDFVVSGAKADVLVLEMSSFQLQTCRSLHPKVAVILNISENHLDQHNDMQEYTDAKFSIFALQDSSDVAIMPEELVEEARRRNVRAKICTFASTGAFTGMQLLGYHNVRNAEVAFQACQIFGVTLAEAVQAAREFTPIAHRFENVGEVDDILYINDSKCTTIAALEAALQSCQRPVILLAGGKFKGGDLPGLRPLLKKKVKAVVLYGACRENFETAWKGAVPLQWVENLAKGMEYAGKLAVAGDMVVLSPATASYDQYKNYMERGEHFRSLVKNLKRVAE